MPKINKKPYGLTWIFLLIILISCSKKISPPKPEKYLAFKNFPLKAGPEDLKSEACLRLKKEPYLSIRRFAEACQRTSCPKEPEKWLCGHAKSLKGPLNYYHLAFFHISRGKLQKAIEDFDLGLNLEGKNQELLLRKAFIYEKNDQLDKALDIYTQILELNPSHQEAKVHSLMVTWKKTKKEVPDQNLVLNLLRNGLSRHSSKYTAGIYNQKYRIKSQLDPEEIPHFEKIIDLIDNDSMHHAKSNLQNRLAKSKSKTVLHYLLGMVFLRMNQYGEAIHNFKQGIQFSSKWPANYCELWRFYRSRNISDREKGFFKSCFSLNPFDPSILFFKADDLYRKGNYQEALAYSKTLFYIDANPESAELLALIHFRSGQFEFLEERLKIWYTIGVKSPKLFIHSLMEKVNRELQTQKKEKYREEILEILKLAQQDFPGDKSLQEISGSFEKSGFLPTKNYLR